jgi:glucose/arabinose dehydrogenase
MPGAYDGAQYSLMKGSGTNSTHWTMTALCRGCTQYQGNDGSTVTIDGTTTAQFAFAQGSGSVRTPASNTSDFDAHQAYGKWSHDLNAARSSQFDSWVAANLAPVASASSAAPSSLATSTRAVSSAVTTSRPTATSPSPSAAPSGKIPASCNGAGSPVYNPSLASGWKATKVLGGLTSPRSIVFDSNGNMLVVQSGKGISIHAIDANGCVTSSKMLISQNNLNHGIQLSADGKTLYASAMTTVYSWSYNAASMSVSGSSSVVVKGMFNGIHSTRTLLIAPHQPNLLLVSHGSNDNWDYATGNPATGRSVVRVFDLNAIPSGGYQWATQGWLAGYGMRNEVGIAFDGNNM